MSPLQYLPQRKHLQNEPICYKSLLGRAWFDQYEQTSLCEKKIMLFKLKFEYNLIRFAEVIWTGGKKFCLFKLKPQFGGRPPCHDLFGLVWVILNREIFLIFIKLCTVLDDHQISCCGWNIVQLDEGRGCQEEFVWFIFRSASKEYLRFPSVAIVRSKNSFFFFCHIKVISRSDL